MFAPSVKQTICPSCPIKEGKIRLQDLKGSISDGECLCLANFNLKKSLIVIHSVELYATLKAKK